MDEEVIILEEPVEEEIAITAESNEDLIEISEEPGEETILLGEETSLTNMDYNLLIHKPKINGVEVIHEKSIEDYGARMITNDEILNMMRR